MTSFLPIKTRVIWVLGIYIYINIHHQAAMLVVENGETVQVAEMPLYKEIRLPSKPSTKKLEPLDST